MMTDFSRRSLLKSAAAGAVGAMTFPAVASAAETKFDKEADVIVLGFGGAGAATAITAADNECHYYRASASGNASFKHSHVGRYFSLPG